MSKPVSTKDLQTAVTQLDTLMREHGTQISGDVAKGTYSAESLSDFEQNFEHHTHEMTQQVAEILSNVRDEFKESATSLESGDEALRAGLIAGIASTGGNAKKYMDTALKVQTGDRMSLESLATGMGGEILSSDHDYSGEAFEESELANFAAQNIMFNVLAARQDEFAEAFFPTKTVTAAEGGIEVIVDRQEVIDYTQHNTDGSLMDLSRKNLIDAYQDHTILENRSTELVPYARADGSADANFISTSLVANRQREISGTEVPTRPLKLDQELNLLGLSQHPGLVQNGVLDHTDAIAPGMKLSALYMSMSDGTTTEVVPFDVKNMTRVEFKKSHEGRGREVTLNFITDRLPLTAETTTVGGTAVTLLQTEVIDKNLSVQLGVNVTGHGVLETGTISVNSTKIRVKAVYDANGNSLPLDSGDGATVVARLDTLGAEMVGYDLAARRSNNNWRTVGTLIDVTPYSEGYAIPTGYPITVKTPTDENQNGAKINGMINAARIRNSNDAVTTLFNYAEQLAAHKQSIAAGAPIDIIGASRHIITPYYNEDDVDVAARVEVIRSMDRFQDVSRVIIDAVRQEAYNMYQDSNYGPALELASAGSDTKPTVLIGCDNVTSQYLYMNDMEKLMGEQMDYQLVSTNDNRMHGTIFITFTRRRPGSEDGLSFGVHAYMPELIQRVTTNHGGSTAKNDRVVPRQMHVPVLPVLARLNIQNLDQAIQNTVA